MKYIQYKENKSHGTFDFPLEFYHIRPGHPRYNMPYHWHTEYEIIRIVKGDFLLTMDGESTLLKEGDVAFLKDGILHGGEPIACIYECIVFDLRLLSNDCYSISSQLNAITLGEKQIYSVFRNPNSSYQSSFCNQIRPRQEIYRYVMELFDTLKQPTTAYEFSVLGCLYHFFACVLEHGLFEVDFTHKALKNQEKIKAIKKSLSIIEKDFDQPISLEDLSQHAGMSPKYFCRFFQEMTQRTPIDYLNFYRIECACLKLATTSLSITEIGLSCGFNDTSYFIKIFKRYKGITPKKYLSHHF